VDVVYAHLRRYPQSKIQNLKSKIDAAPAWECLQSIRGTTYQVCTRSATRSIGTRWNFLSRMARMDEWPEWS